MLHDSLFETCCFLRLFLQFPIYLFDYILFVLQFAYDIRLLADC